MEDLSTDEHIERLYERMAEQSDRMQELSHTIERLINAFLGNDQYGSRGWKHRIAKNEERLEAARQERKELKEMMNKIVYWTAGAAAVATLAGNIAIALIS